MPEFGGYGQFCPIARAAEILTERWVPLIVRELYCGSVRFNDLHRGVPKMSPSLLSKRLKQLEHAGMVVRRAGGPGGAPEYHLTPAGQELFPVLEAMGNWAQRWVRDDLVTAENLDPLLLLWDVHRNVGLNDVPPAKRYVVLFDFPGMRSALRRYWLVIEHSDVDVCLKDPGFEVNLTVSAPLRLLTEIWLGHITVARARRTGALKLEGKREDVRAFARWFALSHFAPAGRLPPGRPPAARPAP